MYTPVFFPKKPNQPQALYIIIHAHATVLLQGFQIRCCTVTLPENDVTAKWLFPKYTTVPNPQIA
jgi:hypothetical protein